MKRLFRLSIKYPSQMPPRCCALDPIPAKYVEHLFDDTFKATWNRKFAEYSVRARVYCPKKWCREWIKPERIQERNGRKYAKCTRCETRVCCDCMGKWHDSRKCSRDEVARQSLQQSKEEGWQRCFDCRERIELKEGSNHMTWYVAIPIPSTFLEMLTLKQPVWFSVLHNLRSKLEEL